MIEKIKNSLTFLQPLLLITSITLIAAGLALSENRLVGSWRSETISAALYWIVFNSVSFFLIRKIFPRRAPLIAISFVFAILLLGTGPIKAIVSLLFLVSSCLLGDLIYNKFLNTDKSISIWSLSLLLGFSSYICILGLMIHFPINYSDTYLLLLVFPIILFGFMQKDRQRLLQDSLSTIKQWNYSLTEIPYLQLCIVLVLIGFVGSFAFIPTVMADDTTYHLAMWSQLEFYHKFLFDVETQIWSSAPFTGDAIHGFLSLIAGDDARAARNIIFYGLLLLALTKIANHVFSSSKHALVTVALFASTPMTANLLLGLQVELLLALLTTWGIWFLCAPNLSIPNRILAIYLISCLLISIKLPAVLLAVSLNIALLIGYGDQFFKEFKQSLSNPLNLIMFTIIGLVIALDCYVSAYIQTGNPTFPLYNATFKSPFYAPIDIVDPLYRHGASLKSYWGVFFDSSKYFECFNFCAGFQYLILPFIGAIYLFFSNRKTLIYLGLPIILFGGIMFYLMQYWRYLFPILPVASILATAALIQTKSSEGFTRYISKATLIILLSLNLYFFTAVSWLFYSNHLKLVLPSARDAFTYEHAPEFLLNQYMNKTHPGENVLFEISRPVGTTLWGHAFYGGWPSHAILSKFDQMKDVNDLIVFLKENNIHYIYWNEEPVPNSFAFREFIRQVIQGHGTKEMNSMNISLYRIDY